MLLNASIDVFGKTDVTAPFRISQNIDAITLKHWREWLRGLDLNQRPSGYEPDELPGCSTPRSYYADLIAGINPPKGESIIR